MKKVCAVVLVLALCFGLAGCGSADNDIAAVLPDGKTVKLGDSREEVEKILGEAEKEYTLGYTYYGGKISVGYRDDVVCAITIHEPEITAMKAQVGDKVEEVQKKISGEPTTDSFGIMYVIEDTDQGIKYLNVDEWEKVTSDDEMSKYKVLSFYCEEDGTIKGIFIFDGLYCRKLK